MTNALLLIAAAALVGLFLHPRLLRQPLWRATVTPLASIIGSGFLVAGPILADAAGTQAWLAMLALCAVAYGFGAAMRHNIRYVEPQLGPQAPRSLAWTERAADLTLSLAYFVSVAYYLNLFAAFGLRLIDVTDPLAIRLCASAAIVAIGVLGLRGGLAALERLTADAVGVKLAVIGSLLLTMLVLSSVDALAHRLVWPTLDHPHGVQELRVVLGLVILVQGFETSRYLGAQYDAATRVRTMRWAQWIATGIYLAFVLLITRHFGGRLPADGGETAIIDMLRPLGGVVAPMIIVAALASQLSAAVADANGNGGLLAETSGGRIHANVGHLVTALCALAITWVANIYEIIAYASQCFVLYYALQCLQATRSAWGLGMVARALVFAGGCALAVGIVLFAVPAAV